MVYRGTVAHNRHCPPVGHLLTARVVAEELVVCRATVYAILERGNLERVWIGRSIRISAASLEAFLAPGATLMLGPVVPAPTGGTGTGWVLIIRQTWTAFSGRA